MRTFAQIICALAALTAAVPALAQTQTANAFDGTYRGVSRTVQAGPFGGGNPRSCALSDGVPAPLIIVNGIARAGTADSLMEGSVTPQGVLVMRTQRGGGKFEGQVDAQGRAIGSLIFSCTYQYV